MLPASWYVGMTMAAGTGGQHTIAAVPSPDERRLSAIPSRRARVLAFAAILVGGVCGALIASSFVGLQCKGDCTTPTGVAGVVGALAAAGGVAVVAVLVLRAMNEWRRLDTPEGGDDEVGAGDDGAGPSSPS